MKLRSFLISAILFVGLSNCSTLPAGDDTEVYTGQIEKIEVDCGGWGLQTGDELYELVELPEKYKLDGLQVRMVAKKRKDLASCAMVGPIIEVLQVGRVE